MNFHSLRPSKSTLKFKKKDVLLPLRSLSNKINKRENLIVQVILEAQTQLKLDGRKIVNNL
jgi:hypothetical protein